MPSSSEKFVLPESTPQLSETTVNIAGILVYIYGLDELSPEQKKDVVVWFHAHGRTRSHIDGAQIGYQVIHGIRQKYGETKKGLILVTIDSRNHGTRHVDDVSIKAWNSGNKHHAQDMLSMVDGTALDYSTIIKYLHSYTGNLFTAKKFIPSGVSLGGHVAWNLIARHPEIDAGIPIVGTPDLTGLLIDRLGKYKTVEDVPAGTEEWPKSIEKLIAERDALIATIKNKNLLVLNGADDTLVPDDFTKPWIEKYGANNDTEYYEFENVGHYLSWGGINKIEDFLIQYLQ
ncbi:Alpha/Beta hydrolase protein [Lipomyces japonicus]|uniref:Alpha/Beta hydrolase protein n=1 Tax=Lipomyces japonicus TaxID=56871 RepID=UPI0034CEA6A0